VRFGPAPGPLVCAAIAGAVAAVASAGAHSVSSAEAVTAVRQRAVAAGVELLSVAPQADLERMLVIRVGDDWSEILPERRLALAAEWRAVWREAVGQGIVAIVDRDGASVVSFDGNGDPQLRH